MPKYITFDYQAGHPARGYPGARWIGRLDVPVLPADDVNDPALIQRCARRAFWSLVASGYGDVDDIKIFHNNERILMDPQKVSPHELGL